MGTVVFFNHPGGEHTGTGAFSWNCGTHRRKYLVIEGERAIRSNGGWRKDDGSRRLTLWAEYEPDTTAHWFSSNSSPGEPESWHEPVPILSPPRGAANTEPWIFGDAFRYFLCRQNSIAYLKELQPGDLLLFGSWLKQGPDGQESDRFNFFLDTVFVVDNSVVWPAREGEPEIPGQFLDPPFLHATFNRSGRESRRRFYWGKMFDAKRTEPFCWVPSTTWRSGNEPPRWRRPLIGDLFGHFANNGQVFKKRADLDPEYVWNVITERCLELGYSLGVRFATPQLAMGVTGEIGERCGKKRC